MTQPQPTYQPIYSGIPFDPLKYVKRLESVGFSREQAEVQAETFLSIVQEQLITKHDLKELEVDLKRDIKDLEVNLRKDIKELEAKTTLEFEVIRRDIKELEAKTTLEFESIRHDIELVRRDVKASEEKTATELTLIRRDIKEMEVNSKIQLELLRRDLKLWFGGMLVTLVVSLSGVVTLIPRLMGH